MKSFYFLPILLLAPVTLFAAPNIGTTDFNANTGVLVGNQPSPQTVQHSGFSFTGVGALNISITNVSARLNMVSIGAVYRWEIGSNDGSDFQLDRFTFLVLTSGFLNQTMTVTGYRDNFPVSGATASYPAIAATSTNYVMDVSSNPAFDRIDKFVLTFTGSPTGTIAFDDITISQAVAANIPPAASVTFAPDVSVAGETSYTVRITYTDTDGAIVAESIGNNDVSIAGLSYQSYLIVSGLGTGTTVVDYRFTPPGGSWDITDNGSYTVSLGAGPVVDTGGSAVTSLGGDTSFSVNIVADTTPPTVLSITRLTPVSSSTAPVGGVGGSVTFRVSFSEPVENVDSADFMPTGAAAVGTSVSAVSPVGSGDVAVYDVTVSNITQTGTLGLEVIVPPAPPPP